MTRRLIIPLLCTICFCSCRTLRTVEQVPVYVHDTAYLSTVQHDSIHIDHFREVTKMIGDTVYIHDSTVIFRSQTKTDTAYKVVERPVTVVRTETVAVEKPLHWWQKGLMYAGAAGIFITLAVAAYRLRRRTA